jgi:DNA-binding NarL/FixJ family response regulator
VKHNRAIAPGWVPPQRVAAPLRAPVTAFAPDESRGGAKGSAPAHGIIIVEDDFLIAMEAKGALIDAGLDVVGIASSATEAIELAGKDPRPMLCVMDIRLKGTRDGIDTALELFKAYGIRSVFATAHDGLDVRTRARPAKPLAWVAKPYAMRSLVEVVRRALRDLQSNGN